jgi:uncharacterized protein YjbI with pentapeptide repeats
MQREARRGRQPGRVGVDWPTCSAQGLDCSGVQVRPFGCCWAHLSHEELRQALGSLAPGCDLDVRGATLDGALLSYILSAFVDPSTRKLLIGNASLENASINGTAPFGSAVFNGRVTSFEAKFDGKADFYGAEFKAYAGFNEAEFSYADFEKAKFTGDAISFKYVKFRSAAEFNDVIFKGSTEFNGAKFLNSAHFSSVRFMSEAHFEDARFRGFNSFQHGKFDYFAGFAFARFTSRADFIDARFARDSSFGGARFNDDAWFTSCIFSGKADFTEARFDGGAWFDRTKFKGDVSFAVAKVEADALFNNVEFTANAAFSEVKVKGATVVRRSTVGGELQLDDFAASGTVEMTITVHRMKCTRAKFDDQVLLSLAGGDLWLTDSVFEAPATIESTLRPVAGTAHETGQGLVRVRVRSLRGTDAEHLTLTDTDLSRCILSGLLRPEQLRLGGRNVFAPRHAVCTGGGK